MNSVETKRLTELLGDDIRGRDTLIDAVERVVKERDELRNYRSAVCTIGERLHTGNTCGNVLDAVACLLHVADTDRSNLEKCLVENDDLRRKLKEATKANADLAGQIEAALKGVKVSEESVPEVSALTALVKPLAELIQTHINMGAERCRIRRTAKEALEQIGGMVADRLGSEYRKIWGALVLVSASIAKTKAEAREAAEQFFDACNTAPLDRLIDTLELPVA